MAKIRFAFLTCLVCLGGGFLGAQTVAEDVLKGTQIQGIEFKNYVGPHKVIETRQAIQGIGTDLGRQMKVPGATEADYGRKYHVIRVHDASSALLSADILILEPDAGIDHIRNLNWVVSAYLQQVFGYSEADGDLLANFVTRYNAYYRGKMDYVATTFIPEVARHVTADKVGLALSYSDWPGKTQMLIPLRDSLSKGLSGSINTEEISNKDVVKQMAQEPGAGLEDRKKLANLKEGEIVQEQKAVAQAEATPPGPTSQGTTPSSPTTTPPTGTNPATTPATPTPASVPTPTPATATTPAPATAPATTPALPLAQAKQQLAARDQALQAERQNIVKQEAQQKTPAAAPTPVKPASTVAFVHMADSTKGQLWLIDPTANKVWKKSDLNSVRQPQAWPFGAGLLVVAGDAKAANGAVRLVVLSKDDASVLQTGNDDVSPDTSPVVQGTQVLVLTKGDQGGWVLGTFDPTLKAIAKGTDALTALTAIVPTPNGIFVQSAGGQPLLLDSTTLKKKSATEE